MDSRRSAVCSKRRSKLLMERIPSLAILTTILCALHPGVNGQRQKVCPTNGVSKPALPFNLKVAGGNDAKPGRYPYMTALRRTEPLRTHFCGAVLIEKDILLTAAHCVEPNSKYGETLPYIQIGGIELSSDLDAESHEACRTIIHNSFSPNGPDFDVALIQLAGSSNKTPVPLAEFTQSPGRAVVAMGWGRDKDGFLPFKLQETKFDISEQSECLKVFPDVLMDSMICASRPGRDVCRGDSGGPLVIPGDGCGENDILVGITSFGIPCSESDFSKPGVYSRVSYFLDWIRNHGAGEATMFLNEKCSKPPPRGQQNRMETVIQSPPPAATDLGPAKDEGGCVSVDGISFGKGPLPINDGEKDVFSTPQECCDLCKRTPRCRSWTYIRVKETGSPQGACFLRAIQAPAIRCSICTSGIVKQDFLTKPDTACSYFLGMDLYGSDLKVTTATRVEDCCDKCKKNKRCRSASFLTDTKRCYLKSEIGKLSICDRCQAAIMTNRVKSSDNLAVLRELLPDDEERIQHLVQTTRKGLCRYTIGVDMNSQGKNLLVDGKTNFVTAPEECCQQCRSTEGCRSWTMITVPTRFQKRGACFLRSSIPPEIPCAGCISGIVEGTFKIAAPQCSILEGVNLVAKDLKPGFFTESPGDCCEACRKVARCKSWTRVVITGLCFLKAAASPTPQIHFECDSGVLVDRVSSSD